MKLIKFPLLRQICDACVTILQLSCTLDTKCCLSDYNMFTV